MSDYDLINGEIINVTITVDEETVIGIINTAARGPAGADGGGTGSIDSTTDSDGTADLDLLNVDTVTATVTGTLTADHIHGNLAGNVYGHIRAGENLAKGDPVYVSGSHGSGSSLIPIVSKADASNAAKMPAVGIMDAGVTIHNNGHMVIVGTITELNTAGYTVNAELYVDAGGGMTATPPTARAQPVARVERVNANNGAVIVKVNGLSASDATASTLVRRDAIGGASFVAVNATTLTAAGISSDGLVSFNGTDAGDSLTFNMVNYTYGTGAASAHRIALGAGTTGSELFGATTAAAARTTLEINRTKVTQAANLSNATTTLVDTDLVLTLQGGVDYLIRGMFDLESSAAGTGFQLRLSTSQNIDIPAASGGILGWVVSFSGFSGASTTTLQASTFLSQTLSGTRRVQAEFRLRLVATGTVKVTFAQNAGNIAPASVFKAGSFWTSEIL
jgi:hypothetical protein